MVESRVLRPLFSSRVAAGFPSPADDHVDTPIDLYELLMPRPASTFLFRVSGESMNGAGILDGDLIVVDRSLSVRSGCIVLAVVDGDITVKRYHVERGRVELRPENSAFDPILVAAESDFSVWGVVHGSVRIFS